MNLKKLFQLATLAVIVSVLASGCSQSDGLVDVTGTVKWEGELMPMGMIVVHPSDSRQAPVGGKIVNGGFALRSKPGKMRVQIEAVRATSTRDPDTGLFLGEMYIPPRYNQKTELAAEVTTDGPNHFEFGLTP